MRSRTPVAIAGAEAGRRRPRRFREGGRTVAVLAALNSRRAYHPASVTKVATTLAFLSKLPPERRFRTTFLAAGPVAAGTLEGDLVVRSEGDPYFLFENAFLVLLRLRQEGIRRVNGVIRIEGPFYFDWTPDPAGHRLKRAWTGRLGTQRWPIGDRRSVPGQAPAAGRLQAPVRTPGRPGAAPGARHRRTRVAVACSATSRISTATPTTSSMNSRTGSAVRKPFSESFERVCARRAPGLDGHRQCRG